MVKSSVGLGMLLWAGIGDTGRVSLSADPVEKVKVGFDLLKLLGLRHRGVSIVSCPSCARRRFDVIRTVEVLEQRLAHITTPITVLVIGLRGERPGGATMTDIGFTGGGKDTHQVYVKGLTDHRLKDEGIVDHLVVLVEDKAKQIDAKRAVAEAVAAQAAERPRTLREYSMVGSVEVDALNGICWGLLPPDSRHTEAIRRHAAEWLPKMGLAARPERMREHTAIDIPLLTAMTHPWATRSDLMMVHDWLAWLFEFDDQFDNAVDGADPARLEALSAALLRTLDGASNAGSELAQLPICVALSDIWRRIKRRTSPEWRARFRAHVLDYLTSYSWEEANRRHHRLPGVKEYLEHRQRTGAVHPCFDILIPTLNIEYDDKKFDNRNIRVLEYCACEIITLSNDIISVRKEKYHCDYHNIVMILSTEKDISIEEAIHETASMVAERLHGFSKMANEFAQELTKEGDNIGRYLFGLHAWVVGNYAWSLRSRRFAMAEAVASVTVA